MKNMLGVCRKGQERENEGIKEDREERVGKLTGQGGGRTTCRQAAAEYPCLAKLCA